MSRSAEVTLAFGGEDRIFRLPLGRLRALQEKTDAGPQTLLRRFFDGSWRVDDVRETLLQGLIGGGTAQPEATKLINNYFDDLALEPFVPLAQMVMMAVLVGAEDEDDAGEPEGANHPAPPSPTESSASQNSTDQEP